MTMPARSSRNARLRAAQRAWIEDVVSRSGTTVTQIARASRLNPSTLTRFLKDDRPTILSTATIAAVAEVTGREPPREVVGGLDQSVHRLPQGLHEDGTPYRPGAPDGANHEAVAALLAGRPNASAWTMRIDILALAGVRPGDVMIVDQSLSPRDGDIVCAQIETGASARTVFRLYQTPTLVGASYDPTAARPETVDGQRVRIAGVVIHVLRSRPDS